jgi:hypothetical protein
VSDETFDKLMILLVVVLSGFCASILVALLTYAPANAMARADCLRAGYPRATVTWDFQRYCLTLDGVVTVRVEQVQ